jgi:GWxTD domain-containing protein
MKLPRSCLMRTFSVCVPSALLVLSLGLYLPANLRGQGRLPSTSESSRENTGVEGEYQKWLNEDVRYIISDEERAEFNKLDTVQQRDAFVVAFWESRNPTPGSGRNPYKEEHYRRLAYANTHFAAGSPGYASDRGRFYIMYGPPDSVESRPGLSPPDETWSYKSIEGIGRDVILTFTDECRCGKYSFSKMDSGTPKPRILEPLLIWILDPVEGHL